MDKILTIVIPTYNMEKYLSRCLDSLLIDDKDLFNALEILVVNDGSKDTSSTIAHDYQDKYPDVFRVIDKENGNYGSCVNRGLSEAKGKYIKILDSDDWFEKQNLPGFINFIQNSDSDVILSAYDRVENDGELISQYRFPQIGINNEIDIISDIEKNIEMHAITYKTSLLRKNGYIQTEGISYTDTEWSFIPLQYCKTISYYSNCIYKYVLGREGQTMAPQTLYKNIGMMNTVFLSIVDSFEEYKSKEIFHYLCFKIKSVAETIYRLYILNFDERRIKELIELDKTVLQKSTLVYNMLNMCKLRSNLPYNYIKAFRRNNYQTTPFLWLYNALRKKLRHVIL